MNEHSTIKPTPPAGELSIADIAAAAGPDFASWLCALFGAEQPADVTPR